jgi:YfiH family protein
METPELIFPEWPAPARVHAACTTRRGGVSAGPWAGLNMGRSGGDESAAVSENRRRVLAALDAPAEPRWIRQVHGVRVVCMPQDALQDAPEPEADAVYTTEPGVVCAVQAADCLPVLLCDTAGSIVAAAHAGWRGLSGGLLERTVAALPVPPASLMAWLGPAIGPEAFEVGEEVREAFVAADAQAVQAFRAGVAPGKHYADLWLLARQRLLLAGVSRVSGGGLSTHADPSRFYSFRRDGVTGRMAALIWLAPEHARA